MNSADDELAIIDKTGGPLMTVPLLLLMEFCFVALFNSGLRGKIADVALFSLAWWVVELVFGALAIGGGILLAAVIITGVRAFGRPAYLRINSQGIWLPYETRPISWGDIQSYRVEDKPWMKGGAMQFLYITRKRRKLLRKDVMVIGRKVFDSEDISSCMAWIDRFLRL